LALAIAKQGRSELHIVSVGETEYIPQFIQDIREKKAKATRHIRGLLFRVQSLATEGNVRLHSHGSVGRPVQMIVGLASEINADLLVIGARRHPAFYEWLAGSWTAGIVQRARCPVLVVKGRRSRRRVRDRFGYWFTWNRISEAAESS
jgi:nucleotide-binding universal stress UspA family protein